MNKDYSRRASDKEFEEINEMIKQENDPKVRGFLLLIQCMAEKVISSSNEIHDTNTILSDHADILQSHEKIVEKAMAVWQVMAWILGLLQAGIIASASYIFTNTEEMKREVVILQNNQKQVEDTLNAHIVTFNEYLRRNK